MAQDRGDRKLVIYKDTLAEARQDVVDCTTQAVIKDADMGDEMQQDAVNCAAQAAIREADMGDEMQQYAVDCATQALKKFKIEKDIADFIKKEFDKKYYHGWMCMVGCNFGSSVTHLTGKFIHFYLGQLAIVLFKSR